MTANTVSLPGQPAPPTPNSPLATRLLARARREWDNQQFDAAERSLVNVLALTPDEPNAIRMLGMVAQHLEDHAKTIDCFQRILAVWPEDADLRLGLGIAMCAHRQTDAGITHLRVACKLAPASVSAWSNLGKALGSQGHMEESVAALRRALELDPLHIPARLSLARAQASLGLLDDAVQILRDVLRRDPGNAEAWLDLSNLDTASFDAADMTCLRQAWARKDLPAIDHELIGFTFAKALESQGDYAQAFEVFRLANASRRKHVNWNADAERNLVKVIQRAFAGEMPPPLDTQLGHEVIFVVSVPRSGSTLVEQILASHPEVEGANEIKDMVQLIGAEIRRRGSAFPLWAADVTAEEWQHLGQEYLARTQRWRKTKPRFVDKDLTNWLFVGAALAMLPAARVVVVRRDPVETCLACYRQCFSEQLGFSFDLHETADYCINFLNLTRFWMNKHPNRVFDLQYEGLVAEPEVAIRRLLEFCDLPFDPACLEPHKTSRAVLSLPSCAQVRQPLRKDTARSALYRDKLDGLRQHLRDAGVLAE